MTEPIQVDTTRYCCALDSGHDGACAWVCPVCHGSTYCWACGGPSGDDMGTGVRRVRRHRCVLLLLRRDGER